MYLILTFLVLVVRMDACPSEFLAKPCPVSEIGVPKKRWLNFEVVFLEFCGILPPREPSRSFWSKTGHFSWFFWANLLKLLRSFVVARPSLVWSKSLQSVLVTRHRLWLFWSIDQLAGYALVYRTNAINHQGEVHTSYSYSWHRLTPVGSASTVASFAFSTSSRTSTGISAPRRHISWQGVQNQTFSFLQHVTAFLKVVPH